MTEVPRRSLMAKAPPSLAPDTPSPMPAAPMGARISHGPNRVESRTSFLQLRLPVGDDRDGLALCGLGRTEDQEALAIAKRLPERRPEGWRRRVEWKKSLRGSSNQFGPLAPDLHGHQHIVRRAVEQLLLVAAAPARCVGTAI